MSDSESDIDQERYPYQLVEFIQNKKGPKKGLDSVDCVPTQWVSFDPSISKITARFLAPPYTKQSCALLHRVMEKKLDAPDTFPAYPARLRGNAKSYEEALERLKQLNKKEYVFTTDSEVPENKAKRFEKIIMQKSLAELMKVPPIDSNSSSSDGPSHSSSIRLRSKNKKSRLATPRNKVRVSKTLKKTGRDVSIRHRLKALANPDIQEEADSPSSPDSSTGANATVQRDDSPSLVNQGIQDEADNAGSLSSALNISATFQDISPSANHDISIRPNDGFQRSKTRVTVPKGDSPKMADYDTHETVDNDLTEMTKHVAPSAKKTHHEDLKPALASEKKKERCSQETVMILKAITDLSISIGDQIKKLCLVIQGLKDLNPTVGAMCNFMEEHKLKIPMSNIQEFQDFDAKLKDDSGFRESFKLSLRLCLNSDNNIGKSVTSILKKYLTRRVARKYTAVKKVGKKLVFKETTFCCCMTDIIMANHVDQKGNPVTLNAVYHSLGTSLANSKDWEGHRKKRSERSKQRTREEHAVSSDSSSTAPDP